MFAYLSLAKHPQEGRGEIETRLQADFDWSALNACEKDDALKFPLSKPTELADNNNAWRREKASCHSGVMPTLSFSFLSVELVRPRDVMCLRV